MTEREFTKVHCDVLVIGSGIAGTYAASVAAESGAQVVLLTKVRLMSGSTQWAQGGIAFPLDEADIASHLTDTLTAGRGLTDSATAISLISESVVHLRRLEERGVVFDSKLGLEGGHSIARIKHVGGDRTGYFVLDALQKAMPEHVLCYENTVAYQLLLNDGIVQGALAFNAEDPKQTLQVLAKATVLATGGSGQLFKVTTNPKESTGDGLLLAYNAGAELRDLELIQFHPTALYDGTLISEACRGEGALLVDDNGQRFMPEYDRLEELAPRDVVSRAISDQLMKGHLTYIDLTPITNFTEKFPYITQQLKKLRLDQQLSRVPIAPAAHYFMGGVTTSSHGATSLVGLYCAGEVASTAFHGANRLASNSLLEGLVMGHRAAISALNESNPGPGTKFSLNVNAPVLRPADQLMSIKDIAQTHLSSTRSEAGLLQVLRLLSTNDYHYLALNRDDYETANLATLACLVAKGAIERNESRGGHYRGDFPSSAAQPYHVVQSRFKEPTKVRVNPNGSEFSPKTHL